MELQYLLAFAALATALVVGYLFVRLPIVRMSFLPGSLATGIILLLVGPQVAGEYFPQWQLTATYYEFWAELPKQLINVVFACLFLAHPALPFRKMWGLAGPQVAFGQMLAWGQYMLGGLLALFVLIPIFNASPLTAALIEISFEGGHGTAAGIAPVFESLGFSEGRELAVGLATLSLIMALISGMLLMHWGRRKHYIKTIQPQTARQRAYHRRILYELRKQGIQLRDHLTPGRIVSHLSLVALGVLFGWLIFKGLQLFEAYTWGLATDVRIFDYLPLFTFCMFGGMLAQKVWNMLGLTIFRPLVELISSIALSVLIATAVGTMSLEFISNNLAVFLLLAITGIAWIIFGFIFFARRMFTKHWFQNGIVNMGQSMGTTATGLLFINMVDPHNRTNAVEGFGYKQLMFEPFVGGGIITALSMPIIVAIGLPLFTAIATVVCLFWMCVGVFYFGRRRQ